MSTKENSRMCQVLETFYTHQIILIEWETSLLARLGYPLPSRPDYIFLVPDENFEEAKTIARQAGLRHETADNIASGYLSEFAGKASHFVFGPKEPRLILVPQSWTGIDRSDSEALPTICAAYLRILLQEEKDSRAWAMATADLSAVIAYSLFDMSYEGDVMFCPEDGVHDEEQLKAIAEKDARELKEAIATIEAWRLREEDQWVRNTVIRLISGEMQYEDLSSDALGSKENWFKSQD